MKKTLLLAALVVLLSAFGEPVKKYVVTLAVEKTVYVPCPEVGKKDAFGRVLGNVCTKVHFGKACDTTRFYFDDSLQGRALYLQGLSQVGIVPADSTMGVIVHASFKVETDTVTNKPE